MLLRKREPGSDSHGHVWKTARSVVEVPDDQAAELLAIPDAGFTVVTDHDGDEDEAEGGREVAEPAPAAEGRAADATGPKKTPRRRAAHDVQE